MFCGIKLNGAKIEYVNKTDKQVTINYTYAIYDKAWFHSYTLNSKESKTYNDIAYDAPARFSIECPKGSDAFELLMPQDGFGQILGGAGWHMRVSIDEDCSTYLWQKKGGEWVMWRYVKR